MSAGKIVGYIAAALLILFGVIFFLGAFSPDGSTGWILIGLILVAIGFVIIFFIQRAVKAAQANNVTLKIDLPANVNLDALKCRSCGGTLSAENIAMVAGAPVVSCPYCNTSYQLTEEPKW